MDLLFAAALFRLERINYPFDILADPAVLSCCRLVEALASSPSEVKDNGPFFFELNNISVENPLADPAHVVAKTENRFCFRTSLRDCSGFCGAFMTEEAALTFAVD